MPIQTNIDVTKVDKSLLYVGKKKPDGSQPKYLSLVFFERADDFGNDGFIAQGVTKEQREAGVRGPILGNWKWFKKPQAQQSQAPQRQQPAAQGRQQPAQNDPANEGVGPDDIPF